MSFTNYCAETALACIRLNKALYSSGHWVWNGYDCVQWFENWDKGTDEERMHDLAAKQVRNTVCTIYET